MTAGQTYSYEVEAVNPTGDSVASNVVAVNTPVPMPVVPTGLTATLNSNNSVALKWTENDSTVNGFVVLRSDGLNLQPGRQADQRQHGRLTDTTSLPGNNYTYEVESTNVTGTSAASNTAAVAMPMVAPTMTGGSVNTSMANIVWTDNDGRATGYNILRSTNGTTFTSFATVTSGTATSYHRYHGHERPGLLLRSAGPLRDADFPCLGYRPVPTPMFSPSALTATLNGTSASFPGPTTIKTPPATWCFAPPTARPSPSSPR